MLKDLAQIVRELAMTGRVSDESMEVIETIVSEKNKGPATSQLVERVNNLDSRVSEVEKKQAQRQTPTAKTK